MGTAQRETPIKYQLQRTVRGDTAEPLSARFVCVTQINGLIISLLFSAAGTNYRAASSFRCYEQALSLPEPLARPTCSPEQSKSAVKPKPAYRVSALVLLDVSFITSYIPHDSVCLRVRACCCRRTCRWTSVERASLPSRPWYFSARTTNER